MFVEYKIVIPGRSDEQGIINTKHIMSIQVERHGGGYGKAIEIYYHHETGGKCIFILDDEGKFKRVYQALLRALSGHGTVIDEKEFEVIFRPIRISPTPIDIIG